MSEFLSYLIFFVELDLAYPMGSKLCWKLKTLQDFLNKIKGKKIIMTLLVILCPQVYK